MGSRKDKRSRKTAGEDAAARGPLAGAGNPAAEGPTATPDAGGPPAAPAGRFGGWRGWVVRLALAILAPTLVLGLLETGLRLFGYGYPTGFFVGPDASGCYVTNDRFGWQFFPRALARAPHPCLMPARKPAGTVRLFVLGSSAAMGTPDPSFSFGRILEAMLQERYPGVQFEVVNAAMTAVNSHVVRQIAKDCAAHEPDLFIIYMGNNEVIGPFGPGTVFGQGSANLTVIRTGIWVRATKVGQLLGDLAAALGRRDDLPKEWRGMEMFLSNRVPADDSRLPTVYSNFRRNLADICSIAHRAGAPVVLSTVAVNLKDCSPLASAHRADLTEADRARWESLYAAGAALEAEAKWQEALRHYSQAAETDDRFADLDFRVARCLAALGNFRDARRAYLKARDADALRFRADSEINAALRDVAADWASDGVRFVDAERVFAENEPTGNGIPGQELFYEHVHMNFEGAYLLARALLDQVSAALPEEVRRRAPDAAAVATRERCAERLAFTPWDRYRIAQAMAKMTAAAPFTNQLDHARRREATARCLERLRREASSPEALDQATRTYLAALAKSPDDWQLQNNFAALELRCGRNDSAVQYWRRVLARLPRLVDLHISAGDAMLRSGKADEGLACYTEAFRLWPDAPEALKGLGDVALLQRKYEDAVARFNEALRVRPDYAKALKGLGDVALLQRKYEDAVARFNEVLRVQPDYANAHNNLAAALVALGRTDEAITHFAEAVRLDPDAAGCYNLGNQLSKQQRWDEAAEAYRQGLNLEPDPRLAEALQGRLAACLARQPPAKP
ncbi:MAG: tetratricopeptide repeat protein [Planctomycetota bacterium]|nr:tetratricopeptide repeat protein [Planctomycetota bacterium]